MAPTNPFQNSMETVLDKAVKDAPWLHGADRFAAGVAMARLLASQIDSLQAAVDPEAVKQLNMRIIPNYHRALHGLGLTPEGYARMTGVGGKSPGASGAGTGEKESEPSKPLGPNPLDALASEVENVVSMAAHRDK